MRHFCTYFDRHYLLRGMALYHSLKAHAGEFTLWVLCFDEFSYHVLTMLDWPGLCPIPLAEFEQGDDALLAVKPTRSRVEYYFTCTPSWPLFLLRRQPDMDSITYLDADFFCFSDPQPVYDEMADASILIMGHRFPRSHKRLEGNGIYNVGLMVFRSNDAGRECLEWWRARCLEWCYDRHDAGRFADQKYLDDWPERFADVHVLRHKGAGLAPWNWMNYTIDLTSCGILVDDEPLIFFHYHALKIFNHWLYDPVRTGKIYGEMPRRLIALLYPPYLKSLQEETLAVRQAKPNYMPEYDTVASYGWRVFLSKVRRGKLAFYRGIK